jgi:hypothetical protein
MSNEAKRRDIINKVLEMVKKKKAGIKPENRESLEWLD